jgi:DNA-binding NtrC family response regulator
LGRLGAVHLLVNESASIHACLAETPGLPPQALRGLAAALAAAGVLQTANTECAPWVVLFAVAGDAVAEVMREHAGSRVLAVHIGEAPLALPQLERLLQAGATDVLEAASASAAAAALVPRLQRWCRIDAVLDSPLVQQHLVGHSRVWRQALSGIVEAAMFSDAHVLLLGDSGTGKELAARLVHTLDGRAGKRELVLLDCSTLSGELAASELFGHERGAYTGAHLARDGAFARADGGTLFLD